MAWTGRQMASVFESRGVGKRALYCVLLIEVAGDAVARSCGHIGAAEVLLLFAASLLTARGHGECMGGSNLGMGQHYEAIINEWERGPSRASQSTACTP